MVRVWCANAHFGAQFFVFMCIQARVRPNWTGIYAKSAAEALARFLLD